MSKKKMLKQLEDISRLIESDIFCLIDDNQDLQYNYDTHQDRINGINKAIKLIKEAK